MPKLRQTRNSPRNVSKTVWYYVNDDSVDLVVQHREGDRYVGTAQTRLTRTMLRNMLSELRPRRKAA